MKRWVIGLLLLLTLTLTGCNGNEPQYKDFEIHQVSSYFDAEHMSSNRYVLYYYDSTKSSHDAVKNEILSFLTDFHDLEYYLLDVSRIDTEVSSFGYDDSQPTIYIVSSKEPVETYSGTTEIEDFITAYSDITYDFDLFRDQHVSTVEELENITQDAYLVYVYDDAVDPSALLQQDFLHWAFMRSEGEIYFLNKSEVTLPLELPTGLSFLTEDTPMMFMMTNGEYANERYATASAILTYIEDLGAGTLVPLNSKLEYSDFSEHALTSYDQTLTISDNLHIEYYYSPYCSHCNSIKSIVLGFFYSEPDIEYYLINASEATGIPKIEDFSGVPALYIIYNNQVVMSYVGSIQVPAFIEAYQAGEIDFTQYE